VNPKEGPQDLILIDHAKKEEDRQQMKLMAAQMSITKDTRGAVIPGLPAGPLRPGRQRRMRRQKQKKAGGGGIGGMAGAGDPKEEEGGAGTKQTEVKMSQVELEEWNL
jgi:hypothetical protein